MRYPAEFILSVKHIEMEPGSYIEILEISLIHDRRLCTQEIRITCIERVKHQEIFVK